MKSQNESLANFIPGSQYQDVNHALFELKHKLKSPKTEPYIDSLDSAHTMLIHSTRVSLSTSL